ncbi:a4d333d2-7ce9-4b55-a24b-2b372983af1e [Thermothielavioides terrestris]|uniref:A4d333d2-7ce9-4b55-a24b-2b372983af1e n=1 Tax=Thermothielavioides terrestris TaxID=2587410 RepID=A0A3S4C137_9PEZI|nr:a4d333d2-7ce9-4b55-a24b-2b372983af1e [Thermothielavioides terrestris]
MSLNNLLTTVTTHLTPLTRHLPTPMRPTSPTSQLVALATPLPAILLLAYLPRWYRDYRAFLALGKGGMPHNLLGYLTQALARLVARSDVRAVPPAAALPYQREEVRRRYEPCGDTSFLAAAAAGGGGGGGGGGKEKDGEGPSSLPVRRGERPEVPSFVAPQRQVSMQATGAMVERMRGFLKAVLERNAAVLEERPSRLEGGDPAVFLREDADVAPFMGAARGEITHVHGEGSSHVTLSLVDAEEAIRKGWAERHRLSGVGNLMPWSYVMLYAPRDDDEFEVWKGLIIAGCRFVSGGKEIVRP